MDEQSGVATRVAVVTGALSANQMQIRSGLNEGDGVILSDMSGWDAVNQVKLR